MRAASLLYHDVVPPEDPRSSGFPGAVADRYKLTRETFETHLRTLITRPLFHCATAPQVLKAETFSACPCLFTFDDGGVSALTEIAERLEAFGWRGHFFITTDCIGQPGFLTADQILELHERGHVIGTHSCSHPQRIDLLEDDSLHDEWARSAEILADILKTPTWCGSVPGGFSSGRVIAAAEQAGLKLLFTSEPNCRWSTIGTMRIAGRLAIVNHTPAWQVAAFASGTGWTIFRQQCIWNGKKLAKSVAGDFYRRASEWYFKGRSRS